MLSPLDLQNKKVITRKKKYDKAEIDDYIDLILENYKEAFNEVQELQKKVKTLSDGIQYYRSIESTMQKALVLAEKTSKETKDAALLKAEAIEKDASTRATRIVAEAEQEYEKLKDKCVSLAQQFNQYKMQLRQVAAAQLELVTSESFDVYSPELDALQASRNSLPPVKETEAAVGLEHEMPEMSHLTNQDLPSSENEMEEEIRLAPEPGNRSRETLVDEGVLEPMTDPFETEEDLDKTVILPDLKGSLLKDMPDNKDSLSVLTADTIDLSDSIQHIQREEEFQNTKMDINVKKPISAEPVQVRDALVIEPSDASPSIPLEAELRDVKAKQPEILEPVSEESKAPTLDSLLQSMNLGGKTKKKKKKGQEEDPFEFLGSVDDF